MTWGVVKRADTARLVLKEYLLQKVSRATDFKKLYEIMESLYNYDERQPI